MFQRDSEFSQKVPYGCRFFISILLTYNQNGYSHLFQQHKKTTQLSGLARSRRDRPIKARQEQPGSDTRGKARSRRYTSIRGRDGSPQGAGRSAWSGAGERVSAWRGFLHISLQRAALQFFPSGTQRASCGIWAGSGVTFPTLSRSRASSLRRASFSLRRRESSAARGRSRSTGIGDHA